MKKYSKIYQSELLENVMPFWVNHSIDKEAGGYFTCLDQYGKIYDTDKFTWLQAREVWMFSVLCDQLGSREEWLQTALHGAEFLLRHGRDQEGDFYFSLDRFGNPLIQPYNIFSDCFAAMAFGKLYKIHPKEELAVVAKATFNNILKRKEHPKGKYTKNYPGTRNLKGFALPMILSNLTLELEHLLEKKDVEALVRPIVTEVMEVFYHDDTGLILENVASDGSFSDSFEGRLTCPGHVLEAMWFMLDLSERLDDKELADKAIKMGLKTLEYGWDQEYGGIYYFLDVKGAPPEKLEWNQKLWWVHLETLVFLAKAYQKRQDPLCAQWFEKVHDYTWGHFKDQHYAEWFGYLDRAGKVNLPLKGGKWKGCFHVPRALFQCWQTIEKI
ncbi:AGE family epimerase/isomerase [Echinicola sediminis]